MPPRYAYWTIIFGNQPTSFRAATREELLPTFRQIQAKHPDAVMMWFASGRLWRSEEEARAARFPPRDRQGGGRDDGRRGEFRGPRPEWKDRPRGPKPEWRDRPRPPATPESRRDEGGRPAWKDRPPAAREDRGPRPEFRGPKPEWKDRPRGPKPEWRDRPRPPATPESRRDEGGKPAWKDRPRGPQPQWRDRPRPPAAPKSRSNEDGKPEYKDRPRNDRPGAPPPAKDRWRDRPAGDERRGRDWRPGGEHKDPRDRFKVPRDVKRARFKAKARRDRTNPPGKPPKKRDDE